MKHAIYFAAALTLGLVAVPASAQSTPPPTDHDSSMMKHDSMSGHHMMRHSDMSMHHRMSNAHMMRWCHSMSHRRMMMNSRCRSMMSMHHGHRMHHM